MKTAQQVSAEKLRGGFYTPEGLVEVCLDRLEALGLDRVDLRVLEPSVGNGAFIRGIGDRDWNDRVASVLGLELIEAEAAAARRSLLDHGVRGEIQTKSAVDWSLAATARFDVAVGNPPYVRFQFLAADDKAAAERLAARLGYKFRGVANLWIPILLGALARLRVGGIFAFVIPTECFTGGAATVVRQWFMDECTDLRFDLFPPRSFPNVLQEVTVVSGRRGAGTGHVDFAEHALDGSERTWRHRVTDMGSWTRYLLDPEALEALLLSEATSGVVPLGSVAKFDVSIVTGANDFFSVSDETVHRFDLADWTRPLLPRIRHAEGLEFTTADHESISGRGARPWILDFSDEAPDPSLLPGPSEYLASGTAAGLHERFKCRIRKVWYRVPNFQRGTLLMSKRSHRYPRVVLNTASVYTTDTIYRGRMVDPDCSPRALVAGFHNSLTLLSAELVGRSFGGGVLELVPSEVGRLWVPQAPGLAGELETLDAIARSGAEGDALVEATDEVLSRSGIVEADVLAKLGEARASLAERRVARGGTTPTALASA